MIDATLFPLDTATRSSRAVWAGNPSAGTNFISRRITGAIIRTQPSLSAMAAVFCVASGAALLVVALLALR